MLFISREYVQIDPLTFGTKGISPFRRFIGADNQILSVFEGFLGCGWVVAGVPVALLTQTDGLKGRQLFVWLCLFCPLEPVLGGPARPGAVNPTQSQRC